MKVHLFLLSLVAALALCSRSFAAPLYSQDFDSDDTANWTVNDNGNGTNAANFFYDYSTLGIPSAPHSSGGTTRGLKLQANISGSGPASGVLPGISVSPTGQSFTGNYKLEFDWWHNWIGSTSTGIGSASGGSGSTQVSEFGILSSGTSSNYVGASDGLFYAADGDGASSADYRVYSSEKPGSYQLADAHNTYAAGDRNSSNAYYQTLFPAGNSVPAAQNSAFPTTQFGTSLAGAAGFKWHDVVIEKTGNIVTWTVDGTLLATTDTTNFTVPTSGNNILFGHGDTSLGAGTPAATFAAVDFTLIDNVRVVPEPGTLALCLLGGIGIGAMRRRRS
ncbi:MAG TPA: PEP-CTERM sorting domain-containing protein [Lacipirellulaceae bacterium]|nr:PEP-CTERM sorting domain-containing protein [Lacipirellulaceae bacterium]